MEDHNQPFQPESVEEQIRQLMQTAAQTTGSAQPDVRLIQHLRQIYKEYTQSGKRVEQRLAIYKKQQTEADLHHVHLLPESDFSTKISEERTYTMDSPERNSLQARRVTRSRSPQRIFSLVASLFVALMLVVSAIGIVSALHQPGSKTQAGAAPATQTMPTRTSLTPTPPMVPGQDCPLLGDSGWNSVCQAGLVQAINQSRTLSNGLKLTLKGAYANSSQIILWYDITPVGVGLFPSASDTLRTQEGIDLPRVSNGASSEGVGSPAGHFQWIERFDSSHLPANLQAVGLKLATSIGLVGAGGAPKMGSALFAFTVSLASSQRLSLKQTVIANGIALTLDSVTISGTSTAFLLSSSQMPMWVYHNASIPGCTLVTVNQHLDSLQNTIDYSVRHSSSSPNSPLIGFAFIAHVNLTHQQGQWTFSVRVPGMSQRWVFHFTM